MADEKEIIPFNTLTGQLFTPEEMAAKKEAEAKPADTTTTSTEDTTATKTEAAAAGTTPDAVEAFFNSDLAEKYGIKNKDELFSVLESLNEIRDENTQLKGRTTDPVFANDKEKGIFEFLKEYDSLPDGYEMVARLNAIDPVNMDGMAALQEAYILDNKDLTRDQAIRLFNREEVKKYENRKAKEDYEDQKEWEEDNETLKIKRDRDIAKARKTLVDTREKVKAEAKQAKEAKKEVKEEPAIPVQSVQKYTKEVDKFFNGFTSLKISEDDGSNEVTLKFTDEQLKGLKDAAYAHVNNPNVYTKGEIADFDILKLANTFAWALYHPQMSDLMLKQVKTIAQITKAEDIAKKDPDKKSGTDAGDGVGDKTFWGQAEAAAKKKAEERSRQTGPTKRAPLPAG